MDIGDILNARNAAAADAQLRQQLQHTMHMDSGAYGMHHASAMHHQSQHPMQHHNGMSYPSMGQPQHNSHMMSTGFMPTHHDDQRSNGSSDLGGRPKGDGAPKAFACSTCQKGFARRSDLARHGKFGTDPTLLGKH